MSVRAKDVGVGSRYTLSDGWEPGPLQHKLDKLFNLSEQRRCISESLKPRRRVGRKVLVCPKSFINKAREWLGFRMYQIVWKNFSQTGKFPGGMERFLSWQSGMFLENLEGIHRVWKVYMESGKFPWSLESFQSWKNFQPVWKTSRQCGKFPDSVEKVRTVWKNFGQSWGYIFSSVNQTS